MTSAITIDFEDQTALCPICWRHEPHRPTCDSCGHPICDETEAQALTEKAQEWAHDNIDRLVADEPVDHPFDPRELALLAQFETYGLAVAQSGPSVLQVWLIQACLDHGLANEACALFVAAAHFGTATNVEMERRLMRMGLGALDALRTSATTAPLSRDMLVARSRLLWTADNAFRQVGMSLAR